MKIPAAIAIFDFLLITGSILSGARKGDVTYYFGEEKSVTFFCALFLGLTAFLSVFLSYLHVKQAKAHPFFNFWSFSVVGFFYLCLDEFFMIHEGMDHVILSLLGYKARLFDFDGLLLAIFGLLGLVCIYRFRKELLVLKGFRLLTSTAFVFFFLMVAFDQAHFNAPTLMVLEDSFKLIGVSFFLGAYASALLEYLDISLLGSRMGGQNQNEQTYQK